YYPNGAIDAFIYGNGIGHQMTPTADGRQLPGTTIDTGVLSLAYTYDGNASPKTIVDSLGTTTRSLSYDAANHLYTADASGLWGNTTFSYDALDNLTADATGSTTTSYTINPGSNQLTQYSVGTASTALSYDTQGNVKQVGAGATATVLNFNA